MKSVPAKQGSILVLLLALAVSGCHKQTAKAPAAPPPNPAPAAVAPSQPAAPAPSAAYLPRRAPAVAPGPTDAQLFAQNVKDAFFDYDKADLRADAQAALENDAAFLRAHPEIRVTIEGHCDERGGEEYNIALGDRRAASTKQFLTAQGIPVDRLQTVSLGKEHPFCTAENEGCFQQNRRGHFVMAQ